MAVPGAEDEMLEATDGWGSIRQMPSPTAVIWCLLLRACAVAAAISHSPSQRSAVSRLMSQTDGILGAAAGRENSPEPLKTEAAHTRENSMGQPKGQVPNQIGRQRPG